MNIGVTGSTGFVGMRYIGIPHAGFKKIPIDLRAGMPEEPILKGLDVIVHLAGKAHDMRPIPDEIYFEVNYDLPRKLADKARQCGVAHFIYISSTKVYGDEPDGTLDENSVCKPSDPYGESKLKAEKYLLSLQSAEFTVSIIRPPLVYGPGVKGNMVKLLHLSGKKYPLPFGKTGNKRSMVFVDNLVALIDRIIESKVPGIFIAGDAHPLSTDELIIMMREEMGNGAPLVAIPAFMRGLVKKVRHSLYIRLFGSFVVDNTSTNSRLSFHPPVSSREGIREMVNWYMGR